MTANKNNHPILFWEGKHPEIHREASPVLLREMFCEQARSARAPQWRNLLVRADNRRLLATLRYGPLRRALEEKGGIRLIYCDPPFAVGADFTMPVEQAAPDAEKNGTKALPALRALAYRDQWGGGLNLFLSMMYERLILMRDLLAPDGSLYLHCDRRTAPFLRLLLDEIFGPERFLGDIVWHYTGGGRAGRWFSRKHDRILHYAVSSTWYFNPDAVRVPYKQGSGYARAGITSAAGKHYLPHPKGTPVDDVWDIPMINPLAAERCGYPTQKPEALLERIILASSAPGDLVADFFCGSGTTALCAERLGRSWIAADDSPLAIHAARKRLLGLNRGKSAQSPCAPFALAVLETTGGQDDDAPAETCGPFRHTARLAHADIAYEITAVRLVPHKRGRLFSLELAGFRVRPSTLPAVSRPAKQGPCPLAALFDADWRTWLDYWSLGFCRRPAFVHEGSRPARDCCEIFWQDFRQKTAGPALRSPEFSPAKGGRQARLVVTLVDIFANESRITLDLRTYDEQSPPRFQSL